MIMVRDEMTREELLEFMKETRGRGIWRFTSESGKEFSGTDIEDAVIEQLEQELEQELEQKPKPDWIPVSERLPEVNKRVLVTSYGRVCYAMMISTDGNNGHPVFKLQDSLNEKVVCETTVHNEFTTSRITAWMPLPEPYTAGGAKDDKI